MWYFNPFRITEILTQEKVHQAAQAIISYCRKDIFLVLLAFWGSFLFMVGSLIFTIRVFLTLPLPWGR